MVERLRVWKREDDGIFDKLYYIFFLGGLFIVVIVFLVLVNLDKDGDKFSDESVFVDITNVSVCDGLDDESRVVVVALTTFRASRPVESYVYVSGVVGRGVNVGECLVPVTYCNRFSYFEESVKVCADYVLVVDVRDSLVNDTLFDEVEV